MNHIRVPRQTFGRYDRILINSSAYRYVRRDENGEHVLQLAVDGLLEDNFRRLTDVQVAELMRRKNFKVDPQYYTKALDELRSRTDNSSLLALNEDQVRHVMWKTEWCTRFLKSRFFPQSGRALKMTHEDIANFIESEKASMNRWYIRRYSEPRPLGRTVVAELDQDGRPLKERKPFDYPSATTLRNWLRLYDRAGGRMAAFVPQYKQCGNRTQIGSEIESIINACVRGFADQTRPTRRDIYDRLEVEITKFNRRRQAEGMPAVPMISQSTVNRRIAKLEPFFVESGRMGPDMAFRRYLPITKGVEADLPMERVEIDDWEVDLQTVLAGGKDWKRMTEKQRAAVPRWRCVVTVAIDCCTRCIVGIHIAIHDPSTPGAKAALKTITEDKTHLAKAAGCDATWPMHGRPDYLASDGGPVFGGEFQEAALLCGISPNRPDPDPRQRGHIEAFFRYLRRFCRYYAGRTFSNVVEKGEYPAEEMASLTAEDFAKLIIRFIVDVYHDRPHRGLSGERPREAWERLTKEYPPATVTPAQRRAAYGFKKFEVTLDAHGVLALSISYQSEALNEMMRKIGRGAKVNLVIDPDDLGDIFVQVPERALEFMQNTYPMQMYGEFLEVPALDSRFQGTTMAERLMGNAAVREFVKKSKEEGDTYRITANQVLDEHGKAAAKIIGSSTTGLTQKDFEIIEAKFKAKARQTFAAASTRDESGPAMTEVPPADIGEAAEFGDLIGTSQRRREMQLPKPRGRLPAAANGPAAPKPEQDQKTSTAPKASRSINQGDDE
ncbi:MAG: hypothetical protein Devi2KO_01240 [Devosia indica]